MHNFCTLFDSNYLTRGLAMYRSLEESGDDFVLYTVCFDDLAFDLLSRLNLKRMIPIPLAQFESASLLAIKNTRSPGEYCWTCTPHVIRYVLETFALSQVTYVDADLYFFGRPSLLLEEFGQSGASTLITSHRYTPRYDQAATSGIYCVQFMTFRADEYGLTTLQWWQDRCLEWCFNRVEDGKFGDQKYLDDWLERFNGVHVLEHLGGGVAPWNVQQYAVSDRDGKFYVDQQPLIFYHFHGYKQYFDGMQDLGAYQLPSAAVELLYKPYVKALGAAHRDLTQVSEGFDRGRSPRIRTWKTPLQNIRRRLKREFNEYKSL